MEITLTVPVVVNVDLAKWADTYGLTDSEALEDAGRLLPRLAADGTADMLDRQNAGARVAPANLTLARLGWPRPGLVTEATR